MDQKQIMQMEEEAVNAYHDGIASLRKAEESLAKAAQLFDAIPGEGDNKYLAIRINRSTKLLRIAIEIM